MLKNSDFDVGQIRKTSKRKEALKKRNKRNTQRHHQQIDLCQQFLCLRYHVSK